MPKLGFNELQEMDLKIQWSLLTKVRAAARAYKSTCADVNSDPLKSYLSALESLAEYVAVRCRGSALFAEMQAARRPELAVHPMAKATKRRPKIIPLAAQAEAPGFAAAARDMSCETLAG